MKIEILTTINMASERVKALPVQTRCLKKRIAVAKDLGKTCIVMLRDISSAVDKVCTSGLHYKSSQLSMPEISERLL